MLHLPGDSTALDRFGDLSMKNDDFPGEPIAQIEVVDSKRKCSEIIVLLPGDELCVGRALPHGQDGHTLNYSIPDIHVSKVHFRIYSVIYDDKESKEESKVDPLIYCEDMDSSNGTYVNKHIIGMQGRESPGWLLTDGDVINIRPYWKFRFSQPITKDTPDVAALEKDKDNMAHFRDEFEVSSRVLGSGVSATVYLAKDAEKKKQVACKIVRWDFDMDDEQLSESQAIIEERRKVMREVKILSRLSHPHVINLIKTFYSQTKMFIFMELASSGDLFSYLRANGDFLEDEHGRVIALQIVLAIKYLHSKGIAHRDIKPENILVINTEYGGRVVLTDFGLASCDGEGKNTSRRMKSIVGTPGYCAPEIENADSKRGYTQAVDMWSLGVLTACILTGYAEDPEQPFQLCQLSQKDINTHIDNDLNTETELSSTAKKFLRALLVINPGQRMSAVQAREHSWFKKPRSEAAVIEERYEQIIRFWKERENSNIMEKLPDLEPEPPLLLGYGSKTRRKLPDTSAIPYIGLDRHIQQPRDMGSRAAVLTKLQNTGAHFLPSEETRSKFFPRKTESPVMRSGEDLFGMRPRGFGLKYAQRSFRESIKPKAQLSCISDYFSSQEERDPDTFQGSQLYDGFSQNSSPEDDIIMNEDTYMEEDASFEEDTSMEDSVESVAALS